MSWCYDQRVTENSAMAHSLAKEQRDTARSRILSAAGLVLATRGLAATVDDVADAANVNRRTIFRHFATREGLFVAAIREGIRRYGQQLPEIPGHGDLRAWLLDMLVVTHQLNARNGRVYWELAGIESEGLSADIAVVAEECRQSRNRFATNVSRRVWQARGGNGLPPTWLVDTVAIHLSGFTTQCLGGDLGRSPDEVARVSAQALDAAFTAALA
jgi:AcrR family transcriptional regulator